MPKHSNENSLWVDKNEDEAVTENDEVFEEENYLRSDCPIVFCFLVSVVCLVIIIVILLLENSLYYFMKSFDGKDHIDPHIMHK